MKNLFDFNFEHFISKSVIKFLYFIFVGLLTLGAVLGVVAVIQQEIPVAILGIVAFYFIVVLFLRVLFEDRLVKFQMAEDIKEIRAKI